MPKQRKLALALADRRVEIEVLGTRELAEVVHVNRH